VVAALVEQDTMEPTGVIVLFKVHALLQLLLPQMAVAEGVVQMDAEEVVLSDYLEDLVEAEMDHLAVMLGEQQQKAVVH